MELKQVIRLLVSTMLVICGCGNLANKHTRVEGAAITLVPSTGKGQSAVVTVKLVPSDILGNIGILYNAVLDGGNACYIFYNPAGNSFSLVKDSGSGVYPLISGASLVENSQCALANSGNTRAEIKNNVLFLHLAITFKPQFAGPKNVYFYVEYKDGRKPAFQHEGTWLVENRQQSSAEAEAIAVVPSSGEGQSAIFKVNLSPAEVVRSVGVLYNAGLDATNGCYVSYTPDENRFGLANDPADRFTSLAAGEQLENSQCALAGIDNPRGEIKNNVLALSLPITFKRQFAGPRNVYVYVEYKDGRKPTFKQEGTWLVAP